MAPATDNSLRLTGLAAGRWPSGITQTFAALLNVSYESFKLHQSCTMVPIPLFYFSLLPRSSFLSLALSQVPSWFLVLGWEMKTRCQWKLSSPLLLVALLLLSSQPLLLLDIDTFFRHFSYSKATDKGSAMILVCHLPGCVTLPRFPNESDSLEQTSSFCSAKRWKRADNCTGTRSVERDFQGEDILLLTMLAGNFSKRNLKLICTLYSVSLRKRAWLLFLATEERSSRLLSSRTGSRLKIHAY